MVLNLLPFFGDQNLYDRAYTASIVAVGCLLLSAVWLLYANVKVRRKKP